MRKRSFVHLFVRMLSIIGGIVCVSQASALDLTYRPEVVGKVPLGGKGYVVTRNLGSATLAPELTFPIQVVYESSSELSGVIGYGWRMPQLESFLKRESDGVLWVTPWGERIKFFPKKDDKRNLEAHGADWSMEAASAELASVRRFTITGRNAQRGWFFLYADSLLREIRTPNGIIASVSYDAANRPVSLSVGGVAFVELIYNSDGLAVTVMLNGVRHKLAYSIRTIPILPKTVEGQPSSCRVAQLASIAMPESASVLLGYDKVGYLTSVKQGVFSETFKVDHETPMERKTNLLAKEGKNGAKHTGKVAGRLLVDGNYCYAYPGRDTITLTDAVGRTEETNLDTLRGILRRKGFDGRWTTTYYHMRWDSAYLGKVRLVEDDRGRELIRLRFDRATGCPTRVTDVFGNMRYFEYDDKGNCTRILRRSGWLSGKEPIRAFKYDSAGRATEIAELDAKGNAARTMTVAYDRRGRPVRLSDGRRKVEIAYSLNGFPSSVSDDFRVQARFIYDRYNRPISTIDANGIETRLVYDAAGRLSRAERREEHKVVSSITVAYDKSGRPVSMTDAEGRKSSCNRDSLGRIVREQYANGTEVGYLYDALGRLTKVVDENVHEIEFAWDAFGLASRRTAANQLMECVRDKNGLVVTVKTSKNGKVERTIRREYDKFDRIVCIEYAEGEVETFVYDKWGRISEHTLGKTHETYSYDYFGRIKERKVGSLVYSYAYDVRGNRISLSVTDKNGATVVSERRTYDRYGRLAEISSFGKSVKFIYDRKGRLSRQLVDGTPIDYAWTKQGQLSAKWFGGRREAIASVVYEYSRDGRITARTANGIRQEYEYDGRGQLLLVKEEGVEVERYLYDKAGNILRKTIRGKTTTYSYDGANQLVSSECEGVRTPYEYDAAGRLVREGGRIYRYGYLDKVLSVTEEGKAYAYAYLPSGQLARADYGNGETEDFIWDGLALIKRGSEQLMNEPHVGGGAPILSSVGTSYFNDLLGTTLGEKAKGHKYLEASQTAFGEGDAAYFTGKPPVSGLGRVFLFRNYRPELGKWQTVDPLGYPDGWNQLAYCGNEIINSIDIKGFWKFVLIGENRYMNNIIEGTCGQDPKSKKDIYTEYAKLSGSVSVSGNYTRQLIYSFTAAVLFKDTELEIDSSLSILYKVFFNINDDGHVSTRVEGDSSITKGKCQLDFPALTPYTQITGSYLSNTKKIRISGLLRIPDFKVEE